MLKSTSETVFKDLFGNFSQSGKHPCREEFIRPFFLFSTGEVAVQTTHI